MNINVNRGYYTFGQRMGTFLMTLGIALLGIGGTILAVKLMGLAYFVITAIVGVILIGLLILFYLFLFVDLSKKGMITIKVAIYLFLLFLSFVVFTNLIESGILNLDFIFNIF